MSDGQVKKIKCKLYLIECPALCCNRTSANLGVLVRRTNEHFKIFLPLYIYNFQWATSSTSQLRDADSQLHIVGGAVVC